MDGNRTCIEGSGAAAAAGVVPAAAVPPKKKRTYRARIKGVPVAKPDSRAADPKTAALAAKQHGLITYRQALSLGMSTSGLGRRTKRGSWLSLDKGVYAFAGAPKTRERDLLQACFAAGDAAVVSGLTAAEVWGMHEIVKAPKVNVTVPKLVRTRPKNVECHHQDLAKSERTVRAGLPIATPMRTVLDIAPLVPEKKLEIALMDLVRRRLVQWKEAARMIERHLREERPGSPALRNILKRRAFQHGCISLHEERTLQAIVTAGLPRPQTNAPIRHEGALIGVFDLYFPGHRLVVECDSELAHADALTKENDARRDRLLRAAGIEVLRVYWHEVDDAAAFADRVRREMMKPRPERLPRERFLQLRRELFPSR